MISPYLEGFFETFKPRPRIEVAEWAERYRVLPKDGASAPGPWRNDRTPYLVEFMNALSVFSEAKEIVVVKGSQVGFTEGAFNWICYLIDNIGGSILALQPTDDNAAEWSKQRIGPSLELCDKLKSKFRSTKNRDSDNTVFEKGFLGGRLFLSGSNSANALASKPVGNIVCDELDRWPVDVGANGDPVGQVKRRMNTFKRGKLLLISSPALLRTSRIWPKYLDSDQRVYEVPCPLCGHYQEITMDKLVWTREDPEATYMACEQCAGAIEEYHKTEMLLAGKWRAKNPGHWRVGFHLSALYSPLGWLSWADVVRDFIEAEGDPVKMQVFVNTILGLPYSEDNESIGTEYLKRRIEQYKAQVPMGVLILTMGVDVQSDRLEYEIVGWGEGEESWGIEYGVIPGDPTELDSGDKDRPSVWKQLDDVRERVFRHEDGGSIRINCVAVDSGGSCTDTVYRYTKPRRGERVFSVKGGSMINRPFLNKPTLAGKNRTLLYVLGVNQGKDVVFARMKTEAPGPGYCHFPDDENRGYDAKYYAGLVSEKRVNKTRGGQKIAVWELPRGARNEPFDIRVYATAAVRIREQNWDKLRENRRAGGGAAPVAVEMTPSPAPAMESVRPVVVDNSPTSPSRTASGIQLVQV